jgi:rRNA maturation protein Nop10
MPKLVFTCSVCGGRSFEIAVDFAEVSCAGCAEDLGEWRAFRERLRRGIKSTRWVKEPEEYDPKDPHTDGRRGLRSSRS